MALTRYDACNTQTPIWTAPGDCLEEGSRIIGGMPIKVGFNVQTIIDQLTLDNAVTAGDVRIIKDLSGSWPKPTANKKPAKGFKVDEFSSWSFAPTITHYGVDANLPFWNDITLSANDWSFVYVFEDFKSWAALDEDLALIPMDFDVAPSSDGELNNSRQFEGTINWRSRYMPYALEIPQALLRANFR